MSHSNPYRTRMDYLDNLVKSRFIEMFGDVNSNEKGFKESTIGDTCIIRDSERVPITSSDREPGPYPYYGANGLQDYVKDFIFDGEFVLMAEDGGYFDDLARPNSYYVSGRCWVNNHAHILQPGEELNIHYLDWAIKHRDLRSLVNGTTRAKLTQAAMRKIKILVPPMSMQNDFATFLKEVDKSKAVVQKCIEKYDQLVKSRFIELFELYKNQQSCIYNYEDICITITDGEHATPKRSEYGVYLLSARNIQNHSLSLEDVDFIPLEEYERISKRIVPQKGDVLISCSGTIGRVCTIPADMKCQMVRSVALLRLKESVNPTYFEWLVDSTFTQSQIEKAIHQSTQANLFQGKIRKLIAVVPPKNIQNEFASFVEQVDKSKFKSNDT